MGVFRGGGLRLCPLGGEICFVLILNVKEIVN